LPDAVARDEERLARFQREAQLLAALNHPNIAQIYGLERHDGTTALVMELVEGATLDERIAGAPLPLDETLTIAREIANALDAAHERGIIHRDLKPANIKVSDDGRVKVLDFGLAKASEPLGGSSINLPQSPTITSPAMTQQGLILGTPAYMSPEQARGRPVDKRADIWAFGCVLYEMVTGRRLFEGANATETLANVLMGQPDLSAAPARTRRLLERCLEKDPTKRLRDIGDVWDLLEAPTGVPSAARSAKWPWGIAGAAVLTSLIALAAVALRTVPPEPPVYEFAVNVPQFDWRWSFSLSPDGRHVALAPPTGRISIHPLAGGETRELPATEGARLPFWSPDGLSIAFFAEGKLKKVAVSGGPPQSLSDVENPRGGTWSADGVILFAPTPGGEIHRVSEGGGQPVPVTSSDSGSPAGKFHPSFLPDHRHFLYSKRDGIYIGSIERGELRRLLPDFSNAVYIPGRGGDGYVLFVRDFTLMAQPFDPSRFELTGNPFSVAESLAGLGGHYFSAVAGGSVLYHRGDPVGAPKSRLAWVDRSGKTLESLGPPKALIAFELSPDETQVALRTHGSEWNTDIWVLDLKRGTMSRLTTDPGQDGSPVWSPDSRRIAYSAQRTDGWRLLVRDAAGGGNEQALRPDLPPAAQTLPPNAPPISTLMEALDWSRDARFLLYQSNVPAATMGQWVRNLWVLPTEGDAQPSQYSKTGFNETGGRMSPDGRWLAYESDESGRFEIYVRAFRGADRKWLISTNGGNVPLWSRDGRELYYFSDAHRTMMAVRIVAGDAIDAITPGVPQALFKTPEPINDYDVSRDGRFLMEQLVKEESPRALVLVSDWRARLAR
jgi:Tol biopolymer transport system component